MNLTDEMRAAVKAELKAERREARRKDAMNQIKGVFGLVALGFVGYIWITSAAANKPEPVWLPSAQTSFVQSLDNYSAQYADARDSKNEVQQNRVFDTRRKNLLCNTPSDPEDWVVKVNRVKTNWVNERNTVWVIFQVSKNVSFNSEVVEETKNKALFDTLANLKQGDKVRVGGTFRREGDKKSLGDFMREERVKAEGTGHCVHEQSATQSGGMRAPEFGITLSSVTLVAVQ
jgi:hypothetical protein